MIDLVDKTKVAAEIVMITICLICLISSSIAGMVLKNILKSDSIWKPENKSLVNAQYCSLKNPPLKHTILTSKANLS